MERLPRGRHKLSPEAVEAHQRRRLIAAVSQLLQEGGYEKVTGARLTRLARVSKADLYKVFSGRDGCFVAAYEDGVERLRGQIREAVDREPGGWAQRVCAGLEALLAFLAADPGAANLLLIEGLRLGPEAQQRFGAAMRDFVPCLRKGWRAGGRKSQPPEAVDEAVLGGVVSLLCRFVQAGEGERLEELFPEIAEFALTPYLGPVEARRIVSAR